ncbi:MAG: FAD-binding molybdopterin dehydrogenase [Candidatus Poribacteria bacterium]|nr:MAG: FAD-binding molybdopterin dehydrogenase [Candidatus Poribacteria bacterium]
MRPIEYFKPTSLQEAIQALQDEGAYALAGGMDLIPSLQENILPAKRVVNLKAIGEELLRGIGPTPNGLQIGALTTLVEIAKNETVRSRYTALAEAAETVGSPQIRNVGTLGGNLCQRPRCWYFRNEHYHCLKKGGARCFAGDELGDNQYHAILGGGPCHIVHPSNTATALRALNATVHVVGPQGRREIPIDQFFVLPRRNIMAENVLEPGELVTHVTLPEPPRGFRSTFVETGEREAFDWAISGAAVALVMNGAEVAEARVVLHAVAPIPWRARAAEEALKGQRLTPETIQRAAEAALEGAQPLSQNAYKIPLTQAMVRRALQRLV